VRLLEEALRFSFLPAAVYWSPALLGERGIGLVRSFCRAGLFCKKVSARQLEQIADTRSPQGLPESSTPPSIELAQLYHRRHRTILVCENRERSR